ncbi:molybdopterin-dependent oxidoreductase [Microbacterium allomyrinae]|uniref:molybdopterin-dependent oxidoreductase n=1 Tax=Microbacterium allomyrinae TaxID=2830666 RepID=UPI001E49F58E|nr:molybdopterin-dependent oxidoreductase [Microbacterium allomyrinae]
MTRTRTADRIPAPLSWVAGVAAVVLGAGLGELVAGLAAPASSPVAAIGSALIDLAPAWAKDTAIALFGTADKIALIVGIVAVGLVLAGLAGWLEARRPPWGAVVVGVFGITGAVIAATRPGAGALAWLPSAVAGATGALTLWLLVRLLRSAVRRTPQISERSATQGAETGGAAPDPRSSAQRPAARPDRRTFFVWAGAAAGAGILAAIAGSVRSTGSATVAAARRLLRLPTPATLAPAVPSGAELSIAGLARVVTPNGSFYRIDTALIVPEVDPADWRLRVHGMVEQEFELTWDELLALPLEESWTTLACVSNEVGGTLIGNARWLGYPLRELLARANPSSDADMVLSRSIDGFTASTPLEALTDERNSILAVGMNGEALPLEHGFPVRMVVPGLYGYVSATKWVVDLEVTRFDLARAYWTDRGWSERGPIKLQSRIDVPRKAQGLSAGDTVIAGVAWHQGVGISGVEVQIDEGAWRPAQLATAISDDTWVQWSLPWTATVGDHLLRCRATGRDGEPQTSDQAPPAPDGATGWHERYVQVF